MKHIAIAAVLFASSTSFADKADDLFKQAKKLMAEKKFAEACPKFEQSYKLDPGLGAELNVGHCYEEWGKLGKAYRVYSDALKKAQDASDPRVAKIKPLVAALEPQVPRLMIHVPEGADTAGLQVAIDGVSVSVDDLENPQLVDPGPKQIEYALGSGARKSKTVPVERGGTSEITLDLPKAKPKPEGEDKPVASNKKKHDDEQVAPVETSNVGHGQRVAGVVIGAAGVVGIGVASYLGLSARSKYNDALKADCMNMTNACDAQGLTDTHDARSKANTATIVFGVGAAALAAGIVVYLVAPTAQTTEHAYYLVPTTNTDRAGFAFGGRF